MRKLQKTTLPAYASGLSDEWCSVYGYDGYWSSCLGSIASTVGTGIAAWALFATPEPTFATKFLGWTTAVAAVTMAGLAWRTCRR